MNQKRPSRQQLAHLSAALYQAFRPAYLSDLGPSLHAISSLSHLIDGMKASVGRLLDVEMLPAGLQCHFCHEGGTPSLHILSDPVSQAVPASKRDERAFMARAAAGRHLLAIPASEDANILEFARHPVDYLAKALGVDVQEMREWLGEKPTSRQCAWDGCQRTEVIGTAMARGLQPLEAARTARLGVGDEWFCPDHAEEAFQSAGVLSDDLCRRLAVMAVMDTADGIGEQTAEFTSSRWASDAPDALDPPDTTPLTADETELVGAIGFVDGHADRLSLEGWTLSTRAEVFLIDWIAERTRRRVASHHAAAIRLKSAMGAWGVGAATGPTEAPEMPAWPGADVSRRRLDKFPRPARSTSWRAQSAWEAQVIHWVLTTSPWAHWTPVQASPSAEDVLPARVEPGAQSTQAAHSDARSDPALPHGAGRVYPIEPTLCGVWFATGKTGVCKDGSTVCQHLRCIKQDHALCVGGVA